MAYDCTVHFEAGLNEFLFFSLSICMKQIDPRHDPGGLFFAISLFVLCQRPGLTPSIWMVGLEYGCLFFHPFFFFDTWCMARGVFFFTPSLLDRLYLCMITFKAYGLWLRIMGQSLFRSLSSEVSSRSLSKLFSQKFVYISVCSLNNLLPLSKSPLPTPVE